MQATEVARIQICLLPAWHMGFGEQSSAVRAGSGELGCSQGCFPLSRGEHPNIIMYFVGITGPGHMKAQHRVPVHLFRCRSSIRQAQMSECYHQTAESEKIECNWVKKLSVLRDALQVPAYPVLLLSLSLLSKSSFPSSACNPNTRPFQLVIFSTHTLPRKELVISQRAEWN